MLSNKGDTNICFVKIYLTGFTQHPQYCRQIYKLFQLFSFPAIYKLLWRNTRIFDRAPIFHFFASNALILLLNEVSILSIRAFDSSNS